MADGSQVAESEDAVSNHRQPTHVGHRHTNADLLWVCCRKLVDELRDDTTPEGIVDAEECAEHAFASNPGVDKASLLAGKIWSILEKFRGLNDN